MSEGLASLAILDLGSRLASGMGEGRGIRRHTYELEANFSVHDFYQQRRVESRPGVVGVSFAGRKCSLPRLRQTRQLGAHPVIW
jgi:hypothetical protein